MTEIKKTFLIILTAFALLKPITALAYADENTNSMAESVGVDNTDNPYLDDEEKSGDKTINIFQKVFSIIADAFKDNGKTIVKSFGLIGSVVVLCCVMHSLRFGESQALETATSYVSILALSGVTYSVLYNLFITVIAAMESLTLAITSFMPAMATLNALGGATASGAAMASGLSVFLAVVSAVCTKVILPLLQIAFAFCLSGAMPSSVNLSSATTLVKNTATTLMAFSFSIMGFVLYLQTSIASASDGFFARSVRFASGVFVPVIGSMLGEASRTVMSSVSVIKGTVGAVGTVVILSLVLPPFIITVMYKFMLLLCSVLAKSLGCEKESAFLYDLGGILGVLMALMGGATAVALIAFATFIKSGVAV